MSFEERRRKRSSDPLVALHYQLSHARTEAAMDTLVLADASGMMVAGVGAWAACEELAAYAPLLAESAASREPSRFAEIRAEVEVRTVNVDGQDVLLCARAVRHRDRLGVVLDRAATGIARILAA
ncbi:MAG: hypothetical protein U0235_22095 [Polyangiaceae bacterium]